MVQMKKIALFVFVLTFFKLSAQDTVYVRSMIDTLSSPGYFGRGYVNKGDQKAANFIANEFKRQQAKPFNNSYLQTVSFPINTFPKSMVVALDDSLLIPFYDYKVSASSNGCEGTYDVVEIPIEQLTSIRKVKKLIRNTEFSNKFILINETQNTKLKKSSKKYAFVKDVIGSLPYDNIFNCKGVLIVKSKLDAQGMWSRHPLNNTIIRLDSAKIGNNTPKKIQVHIYQEFYPKYNSANVISYIEGTSATDTFIVFGGHYDHLGFMGENTMFPGANDNASGIATMFDLARYYAQPEHRPYYSIAFIAFTGEEAGLLGSKFFVENPLIPLSKIKAMINLDMVGTGEKGISVVNGIANPGIYQNLDTLNKQYSYLPTVNERGEAANSDHHWFHKAGIKAIFIYGMGQSGPYHHPEDNSKNLGLKGYVPMFNLLTKFVNTYR